MHNISKLGITSNEPLYYHHLIHLFHFLIKQQSICILKTYNCGIGETPKQKYMDMYFADRTVDHIYTEYKQTITPIGIGTFCAIETWDKCYSLWFDHQDTDIAGICVIDRILINGYTNLDMTESAYALYRSLHEKSCHDLLDLVLTLDDVCRLERLDQKEYNLDEHFIRLYYNSKRTVTLSHWAFSSALDLADCMIYLEPEHKLAQAKMCMKARAVLTTENRNVIILKPNTDISNCFTTVESSKK